MFEKGAFECVFDMFHIAVLACFTHFDSSGLSDGRRWFWWTATSEAFFHLAWGIWT